MATHSVLFIFFWLIDLYIVSCSFLQFCFVLLYSTIQNDKALVIQLPHTQTPDHVLFFSKTQKLIWYVLNENNNNKTDKKELSLKMPHIYSKTRQ